MNTSWRKGFQGICCTGKCRRNFTCTNNECAFYLEEKKRNKTYFTTIGEQKFCFTCNTLAVATPCGASKMIEYNMERRLLSIYHIGEHTCQVRINMTENDDYMKRSLTELGGRVTPKELAQIQMMKELEKQMDSGTTNMSAIVDIAAKLTYKQQISEIKQRIQTQLKSEKHSLSAVAELKAITDMSDKYLIYKIYDNNMTGWGNSYVFKSSKKIAQLAINMDQKQLTKCPLMEEPAYFDGMHKRCQGWKTLTLWLYHPASCCLCRIAMMEVKAEDSANCAKFWKVFNEMLQELCNDENYYFNPRRFITDEAGTSHNGIAAIYGEQGSNKSSTCQLHFKKQLEAMLAKFPPPILEQRNEFEMLMTHLLTVPVLAEYHEIVSRIKAICTLVPAVEGQVKWWLARCYNLFPLFRGYCLTSLNMAEIGHSTLALVDAAWEDVCTAIMQEQEHTAFLEGRCRSSGKGPTATEIGESTKRDQIERSREYQQAFREGRTSIIEEEGGNFIPSKRAKHRPAEQVGDVQGREVPLQQTTTSVDGGNIQTTQNNSGNGNGEVTERRIEEGNEVGRTTSKTPRRPLATLNIQNRDNPPLLCFLACHNIRQCYGCKNKFGNSMQTPPNDIIIKMQVVRDRLLNNTWVPGWKRSWGYFHPNMNCLKLEKSILEVEDIYIPTDTRVNMKPVHINKLKAIGWWDRVKKEGVSYVSITPEDKGNLER